MKMQKIQFEETASIRPESDMAGTLELSQQKFHNYD